MTLNHASLRYTETGNHSLKKQKKTTVPLSTYYNLSSGTVDHEYCESAVVLSSFLVIFDLRDLPALRTLLVTRCCIRAGLVYSN